MRYRIFLCVFIFLFPFSIAVAATGQLTISQQRFVLNVMQQVEAVNQQILVQRQKVQDIYARWYFGDELTSAEVNYVLKIADRYGLEDFNIHSSESWWALQNRVDIIPPSLAIAQAINESAWGTSRFALQAKNLYGQRCYKSGCGIVPSQRPSGAVFEVRKFKSFKGSVASYIANLNSNRAYTQLRNLRSELRSQHREILGLSLVQGLSKYSQKGADYVQLLSKIIVKYDLEQYDEQHPN